MARAAGLVERQPTQPPAARGECTVTCKYRGILGEGRCSATVPPYLFCFYFNPCQFHPSALALCSRACSINRSKEALENGETIRRLERALLEARSKFEASQKR